MSLDSWPSIEDQSMYSRQDRVFCVLFAVLVSQLLENTGIDMALTQRLSLISELFAHDGK